MTPFFLNASIKTLLLADLTFALNSVLHRLHTFMLINWQGDKIKEKKKAVTYIHSFYFFYLKKKRQKTLRRVKLHLIRERKLQ